jgi:2-polyprenyl-3-methyl-5-hydroxy-6-metoxy-1,4-benzoquinol methylase
VPAQERSPASFDLVDQIDSGGLRAAIVEAALELDVFTALRPRAMSIEAVAVATRSDPRGLAVLLDALCALGLLAKSEAEYRLEPTAAAFLARGSESCLGDVLRQTFAARRRLADVVRSGRAVADLAALSGADFWAEYVSDRLETWPDDVEAELAMWHDVGLAAADHPVVRILDVACGSGIRAFALAQQDPEATVVALDSAGVLEVAKKLAARMRVLEQVEFRAGDVMDSDLGSGEFDVVLLSSVLYFFTSEDARALLVRVRQALRPGGKVVVRAAVADEQRREATDALMNAVELLLWLPSSRVYAFSEYRRLLELAGFAEIARWGDTVVTAVRPGTEGRS